MTRMPLSLKVLRASVRALSAVAPSAAERLVVDRFATPSRRRSTAAGGRGLPPAPLAAEWMIASGTERLAVWSAGKGPRVLLVHGWEGSAHDFGSLAAEFRAGGFGVVAFDHPAHGGSTGRQTTLPEMARAIRDVGLAAGPLAAVVAHSLGATAALLALRDGLDAGCAVVIAPPRDGPYFLRQLADVMGLPAARFDGARRVLEQRLGPLDGLQADRVVSALRLPGLVLHDEGDRQVPFAHGAAIAAAWPGARMVPLTGMGHRRVLDSPEVHGEILRFVQGVLAVREGSEPAA
jgi:pimeloyl-ACP methyl ester carboxylesterase